MEEKHWNKVKEALTFYKNQIEHFKKEKIEEEGATEDLFKDLNDELGLIKEGLSIMENKGHYNSTIGGVFDRALLRFRDGLLQVRDPIKKSFPDLPHGTRKIDTQLELIEETRKEL